MKAIIKAISYYLPEKILTNDDLRDQFPDIRMEDLTRLTGVKERHIASENETSGDLAAKSAQKFFEEYDVDKDEIDYLILCASMGDYITPPTSCILQDKLGLKKNIGTFDFNQGCTGYIYGLSVAKGLIESGQAKNILLLTAETISKKIHPEDKSNRAIFGDGAAATLISATEKKQGIGDFVFGTDGRGHENIIIKHGGAKFPYPETISDDYKDSYGNVKNDACFFMNGSEVFTFSVSHAPKMINNLLQKASIKKEEVKLFILHQANRIILETIFKKLGIRDDQAFYCLEKWGNTVQSTIPVALKEAINQGRVQPGDKLVLAGFGVGFSWAATMVEF